MSVIKKLSVFDFDGTLMSTPTPEKGKKVFEKTTGREWPYDDWWDKEESLDTTMFDIKPIQLTMNDYRKEKSTDNTAVIMLTGRLSKLSNIIKNILDKHGYKFDDYYYSQDDRKTETFKISVLNSLLKKYPDTDFVEIWDDRFENIMAFQDWGKDLCLSGRLKDFKVNFIV